MSSHTGANGEHGAADEQASVVLGILRGETTLEEAARRLGLTVERIESWRDEFLAKGQESLGRLAREQEITTEEGRGDLGVWVCSAGDEPLAPLLFMQAFCPEVEPKPLAAGWAPSQPPPQPFRKSREVTLLGITGPPDPTSGARTRLYSPTVPVVAPLEGRTALADWRLPSRLDGIVLLLTTRQGPRAGHQLFGRFTTPGDRTFSWVKRQDLPFVVAAMGHHPGDGSQEGLRRRCGLPPGVPIVPGPTLLRNRRQKADPSGPQKGSIDGMIWSLVGRGDTRFDPGYAAELVEALREATSSRSGCVPCPER